MSELKTQEKEPEKLIWNTAKILLAVSLLYVVLSKTNYRELSSIQESISWQWILVLLILFISMSLLKAFQYHALINKKSSYWGVVKVVIWQNTISNFIATSAGIASYMTMLKTEQNIKLTRSGIIFIITKFGDLLSISFYLGFSASLIWTKIAPLRWLTLLLIVSMLLVLAAFLVTVRWRERFVNWIARILAMLKLEHFSLITKGLETLHLLAKEDQKPIFSMLRVGIVLSFIYMTVSMFFAITVMKMFDIQVGLWAIIYVSSLMQLVSFIPIQVFGGLGVSDITSVYLYSVFGLDEAELSAMMLGIRAIFYLMNAFLFLYIPFDTLIRKYNKKHANK